MAKQTNTNKGYQKGRKGNNNFRSNRSVGNKSREDEACPKCGYTSNNPAWYTGNPIAAKKAGSINFSYPLGYTIDLDNPLHEALSDKGSFSLPGMMALRVAPTFGLSESASSALNLAAFKLYSFIRHENSGSRNYDAPDLLIYVGAITELYSYITWLQRTYLICNTYSVMNQYIPMAYCDLSNIDFDDVTANLAGFAYELDNRINKIRSFKVPGDMPIFQRRAFMFKDIYTEGDSIKDQMYFYTPDSFYFFSADADGAGKLATSSIKTIIKNQTGTTGKFKVSDLMAGLDFLISHIASQEDFGIMSGDILKAYGANVVTLAPFDPAPGMGLVPVKDIAVLEQIQNSTVVGTSTLDNNLATYGYNADVVQSEAKNYLETQPILRIIVPKTAEGRVELYSKKTLMENRLLTTTNPDPSPELVLETTRTMAICETYDQQDVGENIEGTFKFICGSELIVGCDIAFYEIDNSGRKVFRQFRVPYALGVDFDSSSRDTELPESYWMLAHMSQFAYHPCVRVICARHSTTTAGAVNWVKGYTCFNTSEYTIVNKDILRRLHDTAMMSLLHV